MSKDTLEVTGTSLLNKLEQEQQVAELRAAIAQCRKFMTEDALRWICGHPLCTGIVMHPISLMAYEEQGRVAGYQNPLTADPTKYEPKIHGKRVGVNPQLPRNQIMLVDMTDHTFACVWLELTPPTAVRLI